ncbi:hypothetical protein SAMN04487983_10055 [Streptomyces sp. yr375]|uniref:hypothetical protein n=1 Tax=Streptomyces sp. yr375 TaxID=1761906 RepID=UPI0008C75A32|nr:hypothetical protein [Streptomyces sp. yr375]SEQ40692.1 hypothetical protein SAMN04487983_10055 [Streptomyces sp. yr375]
MATAGAPGARTTARLLGPALLAGVLTAACGEARPHTSAAPPTSPAPPASASASATPTASPSAVAPEDLCTRIVAHWARETLDGDTYGDYQSMGLSDGQYAILRTVVDAARAAKKGQGADAATELIDRRARDGCVAWYRSGGPGEGPWR